MAGSPQTDIRPAEDADQDSAGYSSSHNHPLFTMSDEELAALCDEFAEEDRQLARAGVDAYANQLTAADEEQE